MSTQIKIRRDTTTNWTNANPTLGLGEPGYDTTLGKLKIGDGSTAWNSLAWFDDKVTDFSSVGENIVPSTDNTYDIGAPDKQWRHLFVANGSIYIDNIKLTNNGGKLVVTKVTDPGLITEAPDDIDSDGSSQLRETNVLTNGLHTFRLESNGSVTLDSNPFGGNANTGNFLFNANQMYSESPIDGDVEIYGSDDGNGAVTGLNLISRSYSQLNYSETGNPNASSGKNSFIWVDENGAVIQLTDSVLGTDWYWNFSTDGKLIIPAGGDIVNNIGASVLGGGSGGASVTTSTTPPLSPSAGDLWYDTNGGRTYVYFDSTWVDTTPALQGPKGDTGQTGVAGPSAYEVAQTNGFTGTEQEWLDSLVGATGATGAKGDPGYPETATTASVVGGLLTLDFSHAWTTVNLTESVTEIAFSNPPESGIVGSITVEFIQPSSNTHVVHGTSYLTAGGTGLDISSNINAISIVTFVTRDGGTTYYGFNAGKNWA